MVNRIAIVELFALALKYNSPDFNVFFNFSGHVDLIEIRVYVDGWEEAKEPDYDESFYLDGKEIDIDKITNDIKNLLDNRKGA